MLISYCSSKVILSAVMTHLLFGVVAVAVVLVIIMCGHSNKRYSDTQSSFYFVANERNRI